MESDLLDEVAKLVAKFDQRHGCQTAVTLAIRKEDSTSVVRIQADGGYVPQWGKRVHDAFQPPDPGQTRLTVGPNRRLVYK